MQTRGQLLEAKCLAVAKTAPAPTSITQTEASPAPQQNNPSEQSHEVMNHDIRKVNHEVMNHDDKAIINQLLEWRVYYPDNLIEKHGIQAIREAVQRTMFIKPRVPGAYFTTVLRNLCRKAS